MCEVIERQVTLRAEARLSGVGVHSGLPCALRILPAPAGHGIAFSRDGRTPVPATRASVRQTELCTVVGSDGPGSVSTIAARLSCSRPPATRRWRRSR